MLVCPVSYKRKYRVIFVSLAIKYEIVYLLEHPPSSGSFLSINIKVFLLPVARDNQQTALSSPTKQLSFEITSGKGFSMP